MTDMTDMTDASSEAMLETVQTNYELNVHETAAADPHGQHTVTTG